MGTGERRSKETLAKFLGCRKLFQKKLNLFLSSNKAEPEPVIIDI